VTGFHAVSCRESLRMDQRYNLRLGCNAIADNPAVRQHGNTST